MRARIREAWVLLKADRRKVGALVVLLLVLGGLMVRFAFQGGPNRASASVEATSENLRGEVGLRAITLDELRLDGPVIEVVLREPGRRNVFAFDERYFPIPSQSAPSSEVGPKSGPEADESPVEDSRARLERLARLVREEAGALRLKSTLMGPNPMAVIESGAKGQGSSRTLRVGDVYEGFTLISIEASRVVVEKHGVRVELNR